LLAKLAEAVRVEPGGGRLWLLFTAVAGAFPTPDEYEATRRKLALALPGEAASVVLYESRSAAENAGDWVRPLRVVEREAIADVNFCAKYVHNTGIQRVVREVMPHLMLQSKGTLQLVAWTRLSGVFRSLSATERRRVVAWRGSMETVIETSVRDELIVPWKCRILLPEVPQPDLCERLAALAQFSNNRVSVIGYDTIPVGSSDLVGPEESERFARYLTVLKHVDSIVAISESVAGEFRGFTHALTAQGIGGPTILSVPLAADPPPAELPQRPAQLDALPLLVAVGSHEPRKNQDAVLFALTELLRRGLRFRTIFIGGGSRARTLPFDRALRRLRRDHGWQIESRRGMKDAELWRLYAEARFSVFISLHEGYGLPVVESLVLGTPVLTSNYGSLAEIAAQGGCLTVNPRDDVGIVDALERMLTDDDLIFRLTAEAEARSPRTWSDYGADLWNTAGLSLAGSEG
jgi:glycosyltransferase involved in cell wall biosynthesis